MVSLRSRLFVTIGLVTSISLCACGDGGGGPSTTTPIISPTSMPTSIPSATPTPSVLVSPAAVPTAAPTYAALYNAVSAQVAQFANSVSQQCPNPTSSSQVYTELLPANSNYVINTLPGQSAAYVSAAANAAIASAADLKGRFGIAGVEISINYPLFVQNPVHFPNGSYATANYATFLSYYEQVVQGLRGLGLAVAIESDLLFPPT